MKKSPASPRRSGRSRSGPMIVRGGRLLNRLVENDFIRRVSFETYRDKVRDVYDGPQGAILATCSKLSLHEPLMERLLRDRKFDLRGAKTILDVGSGAGQILKHLMRFADRDACITGIDLSHKMLLRARQRLRGRRPRLSVGDITQLPFADDTFDCVTCGYVIEHLPDARHGLAELARVLRPGGRMLLLTSEDNFGGAWTSRLWRCRTYNRRELFKLCHELGLDWRRELWFSPVHKVLRAGGICVQIERRG